jgi:hypothetical protein
VTYSPAYPANLREQCSAYINIYNDWDIFPEALASIAPFVSEIIVVDGGYAWMEPYLRALGRKPGHSDPRGLEIMHAAIEVCGTPVRIVSGIWQNEIEKRIAGFRACTRRYVFRVDADEILQFEREALERFFRDRSAVAGMEMPICLAPGLIYATTEDGPVERQCLLFDREQVSAEAHLQFLWLVLGSESLPDPGQDLPPIFSDSVAFNSHLTEWRTPDTSITRAEFYTLNYARQHGLPWIPVGPSGPVRDLAVLFANYLDAEQFRDTLFGSEVIVNLSQSDGRFVRAAPKQQSAAKLIQLYDVFLKSLAELNRRVARDGRFFVSGQPFHFDLSTSQAMAAICGDDRIVFALSSLPSAARATLVALSGAPPQWSKVEIECELKGVGISIRLPEIERADTLRLVLCVQIWCVEGGPIHKLTMSSMDALTRM